MYVVITSLTFLPRCAFPVCPVHVHCLFNIHTIVFFLCIYFYIIVMMCICLLTISFSYFFFIFEGEILYWKQHSLIYPIFFWSMQINLFYEKIRIIWTFFLFCGFRFEKKSFIMRGFFFVVLDFIRDIFSCY